MKFTPNNFYHFLCFFISLLAPGMGFAVNLPDEKSMEQKAIAYAIDKDYKSAFRKVQEFLEAAEAEGRNDLADHAYRFLSNRTLIANEAISDINLLEISIAICNNENENPFLDFEIRLQSKLAQLADIDLLRQKIVLLDFAKNIKRDSGAEACKNMTSFANEEKKKILDQNAANENEQREIKTTRTQDQKLSFKQMTSTDFCDAYGKNIRYSGSKKQESPENIDSILKKELQRRKINLDQSLIISRSIRIGSSECQVYASFGPPDRINRSVGGYGEHKQFIFPQGTANPIYVYIKNGHVTSFQD